jgi:hypothetical protein
MSVLPESAPFASFFVVFAILFLSTILLGVNLKTLLANTYTPSSPKAEPLARSFGGEAVCVDRKQLYPVVFEYSQPL